MERSNHWFAVAAIAVALLLAFTFLARAEEPEAWWKRYAKKYNCEWVSHQLKTMTEEQLEVKARRWHVPEEIIQPRKAVSSIEDALTRIHKLIAQSGFSIAAMLARRRMNLAVLSASRAQLKIALDEFDIILEQLNKEGDE